MKQSALSNWLKGAIICLGVFGALVYGVVLPHYGQDLVRDYPELAHYFWPWMTLLILTALPCYWALVLGWQIATDIGRDRSFTEKNAERMKTISNLAFGDVVLFFCGNVLLMVLGMNHPAIFLLALLPDMVGVAVAVCAAGLSHLIYKSASMQQDADLTI